MKNPYKLTTKKVNSNKAKQKLKIDTETDISPQKVSRCLAHPWKHTQHHKSLGKCKSKHKEERVCISLSVRWDCQSDVRLSQDPAGSRDCRDPNCGQRGIQEPRSEPARLHGSFMFNLLRFYRNHSFSFQLFTIKVMDFILTRCTH